MTSIFFTDAQSSQILHLRADFYRLSENNIIATKTNCVRLDNIVIR